MVATEGVQVGKVVCDIHNKTEMKWSSKPKRPHHPQKECSHHSHQAWKI